MSDEVQANVENEVINHSPLVRVTDMWSDPDAFELGQRMAKALTGSNMLPPQYNGSQNISNAMILLEMSQRLKVSPFQLAQEMYIVHNKPSFSSKMLIAGVNACGRFSPIRWKMNKEKNACYAYSKDLQTGEDLIGTTITTAMAQAEKWGPKWKTMPEQMLRYRSAAFWVRTYAPEISMGIITSEEQEDIKKERKERVVQTDLNKLTENKQG